jgi:hypothetical protein
MARVSQCFEADPRHTCICRITEADLFILRMAADLNVCHRFLIKFLRLPVRIPSILGLAVLASALVGCAPQTPYDKYKAGQPIQNFPYKAGTTPAETQRTLTDCQIEAAQRVPQQMVVRTTPSYTTPVQTQCNRIGTQTFCNSTGGDTYGGQTYTSDANAGLRVQAFAQCMGDKGYRFVNVPACPMGTTAANLDKSPVLRPFSRNTCYFVTESGQSAVGNLGE